MEETQTNTVELPEESPKTFEYFIKWIYACNAIDGFPPYEGEAEIGDGLCPDNIDDLMRAWALGDKFGVGKWQNHLIQALANLCEEEVLEVDLVAWAGTNLDHETLLFKFTLEQFVSDLIQRGGYEGQGSLSEILDGKSCLILEVLQAAIDWAKKDVVGRPCMHVERYYVK